MRIPEDLVLMDILFLCKLFVLSFSSRDDFSIGSVGNRFRGIRSLG